MKKISGFTLIELLVVIAIIAILAAILFPVFAQTKGKANQTACISNLKQLGEALQMYAQDSEGKLPSDVMAYDIKTPPDDLNRLRSKLVSYTKNIAIFKCPSDSGAPGIGSSGQSLYNILGSSYNYGGWIQSTSGSGYVNTRSNIILDSLQPASEMGLMADAYKWHVCIDNSETVNRYLEKYNLLYVDGHVKLVNLAEVSNAMSLTSTINQPGG